MSVLVRVACRKSVSAITAATLSEGIARRLAEATALLAPRNTEDPAAVMARLKIESLTQTGDFRTFFLKYHPESAAALPIRVDRRWIADQIEDEVNELADTLAGRDEPIVVRLADTLNRAKETVTFDMKVKHMDDMGWPLAMSAAAYVAQLGQGFIQADGYGWLEPTDTGLRFVIEES